ncbi:N-terminal C2 in EEIG1 and EHBP1 proteins-domain-containing protein [Dimargaris cristalligena]|uniref:N-terminal C2 in EEIG1 and EHBP1 proteins-domain-containing protein n=1 Tax=Dimargaris cristalligena TaxID=215637 RepID=A0A4P9ZZH2_9FUNG|nr:N-terminal C2 in EEIG1 and EHBP1 proteins-domain-containing protein [Dimargaris cristalligena]|eukprot:RKP38220.1 N-terminal C2 in EEIG1 and EHBP1 proteins-domain-containing protein [Dimargaris cristalligena]
MQALYHWFISKHRLVNFDVNITLHELINVPLVSGTFFVKWRLKNGTSTTGYTHRAPISGHRVEWNQTASKKMDLVIGKDGMLSPCELHLCIRQEMNQENPRNLGVLSINLAEYAKEGQTTRRYLLQESKSNSTIKVLDFILNHSPTLLPTPLLILCFIR